MQNYQKTYLKVLGYDLKDTTILNKIVCELTGQIADDIHHIKFLMSGVDRQDYPFERLIALTRELHTKFGDKKQYFDYLLWIHYLNVSYYFPEFDIKYFPESIFDWKSDTPTHDNMFDFYSKCLECGYYVEVWEMPDHCLLQVYNFAGNKIKEFRKESKFDIFAKPINISKPILV